MGVISDANLACGFHAGTPDIMRARVQVAADQSVSIGAQVGFYDVRGFGRYQIDLPAETIGNDVVYQIGALQAFCDRAGTPLRYVKLHGALYHAALKRPEYRTAVLQAVASHPSPLKFLCQPGTDLFADATAIGLRVVAEGYLDRAYTPEGLLVPRGQPGAMVTDADEVAERAVDFALRARVKAITGDYIPMPVQSLCVHSDSPGATDLARAAAEALAGIDVQVRGV
jgi:5-oxoprolinase (ATP-hydrolysing) subunit A